MAFSLVNNPGLSPAWRIQNDMNLVLADINITSYTNPNGEVLDPAMFGMRFILGVQVVAAPRGFVYNFTKSTRKLTIAQDNGTATAAALPEIPNGTNHGVITLLVIGQ